MDRKQYSEHSVELLAPAGDLARAKTAIRFGADAVYLGGQHYSLRSRASNFTMDDIREACAFARDHHASIHVTVNEIPHEEDFEGLEDYLIQLQDAGVRAIIVASPSIMALSKRVAPSLEVHCSTQLSVTNSAAARYLVHSARVDRVVLARECTLDDVRVITASCPVPTEAFIHGGMCVNYSGRCTLSNRMTLRDANRGGCAQSCRWSYRLMEGNACLSDGHPLMTMGSKDLMAAEEIEQLIAAGVASFKIEGRMKTEYYVAGIVSAYRHLIDEILNSDRPLPRQRLAYHTGEILKTVNRETCPGFYQGVEGAGIITHPMNNDSVNHSFLGTVTSYDPEKHIAWIETRNPFDAGDRVEIMAAGADNQSFVLEELFDENGIPVGYSRVPMAAIGIRIPFAVHPGDYLRRDE